MTSDNTKSLLTPASPLYPLAGALLGYLLSGKNLWGAASGALAGALVNAGSNAMQTKLALAKASGKSEFQGSLVSELGQSLLGSKAEAPKDSKQLAAGSLYLVPPVKRR